MLAVPSTPWAGTVRKSGRLVATFLASLTWGSVRSAGPTTAREQVPLPPCCCAHGWLASQARNRSTTHTEVEPSGEAEEKTGHRGWKGPKLPATSKRWNSGSDSIPR